MADIETLRSQYNEIIESEKRLGRVKQSILDAVRDLSKYKPGDRVAWKGSPGIIRDVVSDRPGYNTPLRVAYRVGKKTKSGDIHKTQDIYYCPIPEEELSDAD